MTHEDLLRAAYLIEVPWARPEDKLPRATDVWPRVCLCALELNERLILEHDFRDEDIERLVREAFATRRERWAAAAHSVAEAQAKPTVRKTSADALTRAANTAALLAALQGSLSITPHRDG
jgi:hypothetical protein